MGPFPFSPMNFFGFSPSFFFFLPHYNVKLALNVLGLGSPCDKKSTYLFLKSSASQDSVDHFPSFPIQPLCHQQISFPTPAYHIIAYAQFILLEKEQRGNRATMQEMAICQIFSFQGTTHSSRRLDVAISLEVFKLCHIHGLSVITVENSAGTRLATGIIFQSFCRA